VLFNGEDITGLRPHRISHKGIARTFQVVKPFPQLSAAENVLVGRLHGGAGSKRTGDSIAFAMQVLDQVGLAHKAEAKANSFTILERKWLEVGRALAARPKLLLLDEFMAGLGPQEIQNAIDLVKSIRETGVTVVLVEHVIKAITGACDRVIVLDAGRKLAEGPVSDIVSDPAVIEAYLGSRHVDG
jgi:branched-chain amino acid transport system ATP-binding protein